MHVLAEFGHTFVRRSVFDGNMAADHGGAAWVAEGFATFLNSGFYNNGGPGGAPADGGAVAAGLG